jgi:hypothetical protein
MGYDLAWKERDPDDDPSAWFRFSIWQMPTYRDYMTERGMLVEAPLPEVITGLTVEDGTLGPIPEYKLCSNDGWLITVREITASLDALLLWEIRQQTVYGDNWTDPLLDEDQIWRDWLRFLHLARSHGGITVW